MASLPRNIREILLRIYGVDLEDIEEIRLREGRPISVCAGNRIYHLDSSGHVVSAQEAYIVERKDIETIVQLISNYSIYAFEDELKNGFITIRGGHRVGLTGKVIMDGGQIKTQKYISCVNVRITKEFRGIAENLMRYIMASGRIKNTLIVSPPRCGKTTLLRDIGRNISWMGFNVGIVDERSEIAGCHNGVPQRDVGPNTDVLDGCPKDVGIMLMIRAMSPAVIITDEIGGDGDIKAICECLKAGVSIITSVHGYGVDDVKSRPALRGVFENALFDRYIILSSRLGTGTLEGIFDGKGDPIYVGPRRLEVKK
uniref:stage III sporulation protein AA n=1 Tax=Caldanaerobius polysaccharolyticus TaxID=44256 RepID=UPI000553828D